MKWLNQGTFKKIFLTLFFKSAINETVNVKPLFSSNYLIKSVIVSFYD